MSVSFEKAFGIHQHTLVVRNDRAEALAGNLANADTPGYKARDVDFNNAMVEQAHLLTVNNDPPMTKTNERHMDLSDLPRDPELILKYRLPYQADTGNGNTVEVGTERMNYTSNTLEYQASLQFLNGRISKLKEALTSD